jgi:thioredoxin-dependent peroxiredoxin
MLSRSLMATASPHLARRRVLVAGMVGAALCTWRRPARAALVVGAPAPLFAADAALDGKDFRFDLAQALRQGPVVLYFYPKAFTSGCTVEAHTFAEATPKFEALGARVVGMSTDDIATLRRFSVEACRSKFAVAADPDGKVMKQYDAAIGWLPNTADRVSYVITPDRKVLYAHAGMAPEQHVLNTLQAVERWKRGTSASSTGGATR